MKKEAAISLHKLLKVDRKTSDIVNHAWASELSMRGEIARLVVAFGAMIAMGSATAMTTNSKAPPGECRVAAGSKLSADMNRILCSEAKRVVAEAVPGSRFSIKMTAVSSSRLAAEMTINGKPLPKQNFAVMDAKLDLASIRRFAQSLGEIAKAANR